jgi:L-ribulose-5-phosphate 3-epimerase
VITRRTFIESFGVAAAGIRLARGAERKFKLGVTTDEIAPDLESALRFLREFGLEWAEIRNVWSKYVTDLPLEDVRKARRLLDDAKVRLSVLDTALYKCALPGLKLARSTRDDYPYDQQDALLGRALERAEILGTRFIRIFAFWRTEDVEAAWPRMVDHLGRSAERARAAGSVLLVENVNGGLVETSAECGRLLATVSSPALGLAWDPNNAFCAPEVPFPDGYALLDKKRVHHIHLRDARHNAGKCEWMPTGKGEIDNVGLLRALIREDYKGTLTLETHYQRPDRNKELATRESLEGLLKVIAAAEAAA